MSKVRLACLQLDIIEFEKIQWKNKKWGYFGQNLHLIRVNGEGKIIKNIPPMSVEIFVD